MTISLSRVLKSLPGELMRRPMVALLMCGCSSLMSVRC